MKDCVSGLDTTTSKVSTSRRPVRVGINASEKNQVILQHSPTLFKSRMQFKGGTHNHSTPRLQLPSLEFSSCTPCNAPFLRYEELDQAAVDLCVDVPRLRPPSCPDRNRFSQPDAGHAASNSRSSCLTSESISGFKKARHKCLLKATRRAKSSARTRSAMSVTLSQQWLSNALSEVTILTNSAKKCLSMHRQTGISRLIPFNIVRTIFCSLATPATSSMRRAMRDRNSGQG